MEFEVRFDENDHEHEHEERIVEVFSISESGEETFFEKLEEYEKDGSVYWICQEVFLDERLERIVDRGEFQVFKLISREEEYLEILDPDEAEVIFEDWKKSLEDQ